MAAITNYGELKTEIANELNRTGYTNEIPGWINRVEGYVNRHCRLPIMQSVASGSLSSSSLTLPSDHLETINLIINDGDCWHKVSRNTYADVKAQGSSGFPKGYSEDGTTITVGPGPDSTYSYELHYYSEFTEFSSDPDTNWVLDNIPELYLAGSLVHANRFLKDSEMLAVWQAEFNRAYAEIKTYENSVRFPGGSLQVVSA